MRGVPGRDEPTDREQASAQADQGDRRAQNDDTPPDTPLNGSSPKSCAPDVFVLSFLVARSSLLAFSAMFGVASHSWVGGA